MTLPRGRAGMPSLPTRLRAGAIAEATADEPFASSSRRLAVAVPALVAA